MRKLIPLLLLMGCATQSPSVPVPTTGAPERIAFDTIVTAKAFLDSEKAAHPECSTASASTLCIDLQKATAAKDLLIDSLEVYCSGPQFESGGVCQTNPANMALTKLQAATAYYNQTAADVKSVIK